MVFWGLILCIVDMWTLRGSDSEDAASELYSLGFTAYMVVVFGVKASREWGLGVWWSSRLGL